MTAQILAQLFYVAYLGRPGDTIGLQDNTAKLIEILPTDASLERLLNLLNTERSLATNLLSNFSSSLESQQLYSGGPIDVINTVYLNLFSRPAENEGLQFWLEAFNISDLDPSQLSLEILNAALKNGVEDAQIAMKKLDVAQLFTQTLNMADDPSVYSGDAAADAARAMLNSVTNNTEQADFEGIVGQTLQELGAIEPDDTSEPMPDDPSEPLPDNSPVLTTGRDTITGTGEADLFTAVVSSLPANNTLSADDQIDGAAGVDTLNVSLQGAFTGFTSGFLTDVESIVLANDSGSAHSFNATGVTGALNYMLNTQNGEISLVDLGATNATITVNNQTGGAINIAYAAGVTDALSNSQIISLNNVGTIASTGVSQVVVDINATGIESLVISSTGTNVVSLDGVTEAQAVTVAGAGNVTVADLAAGVTRFDSGSLAGNTDVNLTGAMGVNSITTGSGNDTIRVIGNSTNAITQINSDGGEDILILSDMRSALQYEMTGVETLGLSGNSAGLIFSAENVVGLRNIELQPDFSGAAALISMGAVDLSVSSVGSGVVDATLSVDSSGSLSFNAIIQGESAQVNSVNLNASKAKELNAFFGDKSTYAGSITANSASNVSVSGFALTAAVTAAAATSVGINVEQTSSLQLNAQQLNSLNIVSGGGFNLQGDQVARTISIITEGSFSSDSLLGAEMVSLSGTGAGRVDGEIGSLTQGYDLNLKASGFKNEGLNAAFTVTDSLTVGEGKTITVDVSEVDGAVSLGGATVSGGTSGAIVVNADGTQGRVTTQFLIAESVTINAAGSSEGVFSFVSADQVSLTGSMISNNTFNVSATRGGTISGGALNDFIELFSVPEANTKALFTLTGGLGSDLFEIRYAGGQTVIEITDFNPAEDVLNLFRPTAVYSQDEFGSNAGSIISEAIGMEIFNSQLASRTVGSDVYYATANDSYVVLKGITTQPLDPFFRNGDMVIKLIGVNNLGNLEGTILTG